MEIRITSLQDGFRRCGEAHSKEPVTWPDDKFSKKELVLLEAEPMLKVEKVKDKKGTEGKAQGKKQEGK